MFPTGGRSGRSPVLRSLAGLTPPAVSRAVLRDGMAALAASDATLALLDADGTVLPIATTRSDEAAEDAAPLTLQRLLPLSLAASERAAVWIRSGAEARVRFPVLTELEVPGGASVAIPLVTDGEVFGVLGFGFVAPRRFTRVERALAQTLADRCARALMGVVPDDVAGATQASPGTGYGLAVLDAHGCVVEADDVWIAFAQANGVDTGSRRGVSYAGVCEAIVGVDGAREVAAAIEVAWHGTLTVGRLTVRCHSRNEGRSYDVMVSPRTDDAGTIVGISVVLGRVAH